MIDDLVFAILKSLELVAELSAERYQWGGSDADDEADSPESDDVR